MSRCASFQISAPKPLAPAHGPELVEGLVEGLSDSLAAEAPARSAGGPAQAGLLNDPLWVNDPFRTAARKQPFRTAGKKWTGRSHATDSKPSSGC